MMFICLAVIISFGAMGVGFAAWQEGMEVQGVVSTGEIDPVFSMCEVLSETCWPGRAQVLLQDGGKRLRIHIHDAYPGYHVHFRYRVTNLGTVPVRYVTEVYSASPALEVQLSVPEGVIAGYGDYREGDLWLTVNNVEEHANYDFYVSLSFQQWNSIGQS